MAHKYYLRLVATMAFMVVITACGEKPGRVCNSNLCRKGQDQDLGVPATSLLAAYQGTALAAMLPPQARLIAAKVFYDLLTNGNQNDSRKWYVGQRPAEKNKLLKGSRRPSELDVAYTGFIEVMPPTETKGSVCRKFEQDVTLHTKIYGELKYKSRGKACRRMASSWKVTEDYQY